MGIKDYTGIIDYRKVDAGHYILRSLVMPECVAQIQGPWRPGQKWSIDLYKAKPEFDRAWYENKITTRQRGVPEGLDRLAAAMAFARTNSVHPDIADYVSKSIPFQKSRAACFDKFYQWAEEVENEAWLEKKKLANNLQKTSEMQAQD